MAHGQMHGAALAAALAVITCLRARDCPPALAVSAGPSWREPELASLPGPAAEGGRGPAAARLAWAGRGHGNDSRPRQLAIHCRTAGGGDPGQACPERRKEGLVMRVQWQ
jgi:hypothetical protein